MIPYNSIIFIISERIGMIKDGKWRCQVCQFDNIDDLTSCEMCESPQEKDNKPAEHIKQQMNFEKEPGIICPNKSCSHYNSLQAENCSKCKRSLFGQHPIIDEKGGKTKSSLKYCYKCAFQNDSQNITCVNCDTDLFEKKIPIHSIGHVGGFMAGKTHGSQLHCEDCGGQMKITIPTRMAMGLPITYDDYMCPKCAKSDLSSLGKLCIFCDQHLTQQESEFHSDVCIPRASFYNRQGNPTLDRCSSLQVQTIHHMHRKYQAHHEQNKCLLLYRIKKLGYKQKDLENLHHYIMHYAPIIIHFRVQNFQFYAKDTHYRNCFEVQGVCPSRVQWQDRMFDKKHHNASYYERVKYGTMNFTNDPRGVNACIGYGQSYFLLKSHVRDRCTITDMDSASLTATIGTFRFIFHVLVKLSDAQLRAAFEGSRGKEMLSNVISVYKQIQIHGPVQFSKDIERVYLCRQEFLVDTQTYERLVKQFCDKNKLEFEFFDRKDPHGSAAHMANKVVKAPQRVLGKDQKQLNLDEQDVERARGLPYGSFGFGFFPSKFAKPIKKGPHKK